MTPNLVFLTFSIDQLIDQLIGKGACYTPVVSSPWPGFLPSVLTSLPARENTAISPPALGIN